MFRTQEQINEVSKRTNISAELVRKLGIMMSKVKLAKKNLDNLSNDNNQMFYDINIDSAKSNLKSSLNFFEEEFLRCKLW